jgi:lipopolysaccharide/colanic/teichoic acid biosynthesis glycosyltransferase
MEPNILASAHQRATPGAEVWPPQTDDAAQLSPRDGKTVALRPALAIGTRAAAGYGGNGHVSAHGNGMARWPELVLGPGGTLAQTLPIYEAPPETGLYLRFGKRLLDLVGASLGLLLGSPLLLIAAIIIKLESRGPVIYKSIRIGRGARPFTFFKLRSMVDGADQHRHTLSHLNETDGPVFKIAADPRVTRMGRLLRVTSVDELPQLWNVLRGEMSLVGPRPPIAEEVVQYEPWQLRRLDVVPGITCLWQISGRSRIGFQEWMRLDLEYIRHRSFWLDLKILIRTIPAVLSREGAY